MADKPLYGYVPRAPSGPAAPPVEPYGFLRGLGEEALYETGAASLFGKPSALFLQDPSKELQAWEAQHPILDYGTALGAFAATIPFGGGIVKAATKIPAMARTAEALAAASKAPGILKPAAATAGKVALDLAAVEPFKLGTMTGMQALGTVDPNGAASLPEVAAWDLLGGGIGAGGFGLAKAGWRTARNYIPWKPPAQKMADLAANFPVKGNVQSQLKFLYDNVDTMTKTDEPWVRSYITDLERQVLGQQSKGARYVPSLASGADAKEVNQLFKPRKTGVITRQFIRHHATGYESREAADEALARLGLQPKWGRHVQYPRMLEAVDEAKGAALHKTVTKNLSPTASGWYVGDDPQNGLYVLAKKLDGDPTKGAAGDRWAILKSGEPNEIVGTDVITAGADRIANYGLKLRKFRDREALKDLPEDSFPKINQKYEQTFGAAIDAGAGTPGQVLSKTAGAGFGRTMMDTIRNATVGLPGATGRGEAMDIARGAFGAARDLVVPGQREFVHQPLAERIRLQVQGLADSARSKGIQMLFGNTGLKDEQSIFGRILSPFAQRPKGLKELVDSLKDEDMALIKTILDDGIESKDVTSVLADMKADPAQMGRVSRLLDALQKSDDDLMAETHGVQKLYGEKLLEPRKAHYLVNHTWRGDWRHKVLNDKGQIIAMGSGNRAEATESAHKLANDLGGRVDDKGPSMSAFNEDSQIYDQVLTRQRALIKDKARALGLTPQSFRAGKGVKGFIGQEKPMTKDELFNIVQKTVMERYKHLAELTVKHDVVPKMMEVHHRHGAKTYDNLTYRINQMFGIKGKYNKYLNQVVDKALAPIMGRNSADKVVGGLNQAELYLTLLIGNLAHPVMNALTFMQTVVPKAAMVLGADPEGMRRVMGYSPAVDATGRPRGVMSHFEPMKLAFKSFRDMAKPDPELRKMFDKAAGEGVITAGIQERYIGENSDWGKLITGDLAKTPSKLFSALSFIPKKSEEISRAHAFVVGKNLGTTIGIKDPEQLYQFAKQFTHRTMYQYTTADRPKLFNGPLGSLAGLFKNWSAHYMSDMALYGGEAMRRGSIAPILWGVGGTQALAGLGGQTLFGMADSMSKMAMDEPLMDQFYSALGDENAQNGVSDAMFYGLPALFGVSLQANAQAPFSNPVKDISYLTNFQLWERAKRVGRALGYGAEQLAAGQNPLENPEMWDKAAYAFGPRALYNAMGRVEGGALKAVSNGRPIIDGLDDADYWNNVFSLTPLEVSKAYTLQDEVFKKKELQAAQTTRLGEAYYQAWAAGNSDEMAEVIRYALATGASLPNVMRSAKDRMRGSLVPSLERSLFRDPEMFERAKRYGVELGG